MREIAFRKELDKIKSMPHEVQEVIKGIVEVLSKEYGEDRNYKDDGGFVVVLEKSEDFLELNENTHIDCNEVIPEYVDKIECIEGQIF